MPSFNKNYVSLFYCFINFITQSWNNPISTCRMVLCMSVWQIYILIFLIILTDIYNECLQNGGFLQMQAADKLQSHIYSSVVTAKESSVMTAAPGLVWELHLSFHIFIFFLIINFIIISGSEYSFSHETLSVLEFFHTANFQEIQWKHTICNVWFW